MLLDLCTGIAGAALLAATEGTGVNTDLYLPLRYGRVVVREQMPRRFYCRATWQSGGVDSETQVFDLEFLDRDGRDLGGIREFTVKRAPREALLRGLGADASRLLYRLGWRETPAPATSESGERDWSTWLMVGSDDALAERMPGALRAEIDRSWDREHWQSLVASAQERGTPLSGIVFGIAGCGRTQESSTEFTARLETELRAVLGVVQNALADGGKLSDGMWIVTERALATEPGEPVDPVQSALWGLGRTIIGEEPGLRCRLVDHDGSDGALHALAGLFGAPPEESELALRQGKFLVPRLLPWVRGGQLTVPRGTDYVLAPTERGALDNLRVTETEVDAPGAGYVQVRV